MKTEIIIYDIFGKEVLKKTIVASSKTQDVTIDVSNFKNGVYIIQLHAENIFYRTKIVKM